MLKFLTATTQPCCSTSYYTNFLRGYSFIPNELKLSWARYPKSFFFLQESNANMGITFLLTAMVDVVDFIYTKVLFNLVSKTRLAIAPSLKQTLDSPLWKSPLSQSMVSHCMVHLQCWFPLPYSSVHIASSSHLHTSLSSMMSLL